MEAITISLETEQYETIEAQSTDEGPYSSKSDAVRQLLDRGFDYDSITEELSKKEERIEQLEQRNEELNKHLSDINDLETENQRLKNEKRKLIRDREDNRELAEYVEGERDLQEMERERRNAPIWDRIRWLIYGRE